MNAVRYYLGQQMPEYMVPEKIIFLDRIPLTKNGKPDRVRIEELVSEEEATELIPPRTETEKKIAEIADSITKAGKQIVLVAGTSSSGTWRFRIPNVRTSATGKAPSRRPVRSKTLNR